MSTHYTKPVTTIDQQIDLLESRGLIIPNREKARHYFHFISYYRLSGYAMSFEEIATGKRRSHQFIEGTSFDDIISLCDFDRHLRMLVMDAIERIEVAVRAQINSQMALGYNDSHWYLRRELFKPKFNYDAFIKKCASEQNNSKEHFVLHYKKSYSTPQLVPSWMLTELLSMGAWSTIYKNIVKRRDRNRIAKNFKLSHIDLESWLHAITYIRNLCAHHSRLWNRHFSIPPKQISNYIDHLTPNTTFSAQAAIIHLLLNVVSPDILWTTRLYELIKAHSIINRERMGFCKNWQDDVFWNVRH